MFKVGERIVFYFNGELTNGIVVEEIGDTLIVKMLDNSRTVVKKDNVI